MDKFIKNFIIGGLIVSTAEYLIHKDTKNIKYVGIMVHGVPLAFLTTFLLLKNENSEKILVKYGIYLSIIITLSMGILYYFITNKNANKYINKIINNFNLMISTKYFVTIISVLIWAAFIYYYLNNVE